MCITLYSLFTVCGHYPCTHEERCETYRGYSSLKKRLVYCCDNEVRTVNFVFGWCRACEEILFENAFTQDEDVKGKGKERERKKYAFEPRNIDAIRRYWEYKFIIGSATAIEPTKRLRFVTNLDQDMARGAASWASISTFNRMLDMMQLGRQISLTQRAMGFDQLTVDEATLQKALLTLRPSEIWLGPKKHSYAIASRDRFATLLHTVRLATVMWANGNNEVYDEKPAVSSYWESPYASGIWKVRRYGEVGAGAAEAPCITGLTWRGGLKLRLEALAEALSHIVEAG
ncbi:hypothetical protein ACQKWADRAFT_203897 [Trichoderma austrokoningii]